MKLKELENKKILILGLGKEGLDNFVFLRNLFPKKRLGLADQREFDKFSSELKKLIEKDRNLDLNLGKNYLDCLKNYDVIIKTPGIPLSKISSFLNPDQGVTSQTEIFLDNCPGLIIGVTGTKGKGTTVSLIYQILKNAGLKAHLVGNIGEPVLSYLKKSSKEDVFVYEFSSHQLQNLKKSPPISVFLNLYPAHLDYYQDFEEYKKAKERITLFQETENWFIFNQDQKELRDLAQRTKAQRISFGLQSENLDCFVQQEWIVFKQEKILEIKDFPLKARFYLNNLMAAIAVAKILDLSNQTIKRAIKNFKPLPHRLQFVGTIKGIDFYNDSLATVPESVILAIETLEPKVETLLLGGYEARQDFCQLAKKILKARIKNLILFPPTGQRIHQQILRVGERKQIKTMNFFFVDSMKKAIDLTFENTQKGKICLLSPACPSFGVFKNYKERGNLFAKYAQEYGQK
jgi:UDP-N-acetylmuramoylalanine--D-glutamate ligase